MIAKLRKKVQELKNQEGFTLVELLAVIVILGIIAAIAVPAIGNIINNTREDAHNSNALSVLDAARLAYASGLDLDSNVGETNDTGGYTIEDLVEAGFLDGVPSDPDGDGSAYSATDSFVSVNVTNDDGVTYTITLAADGGSPLRVDSQTKTELNGGTTSD